MRPPGGGEPGGGIGEAIALTYLGICGGATVLIGVLLAFVGLRQPPRRWGMMGLVLNLGSPTLCFAAYLLLAPLLRPQPPPTIPPSDFFVWCRENNFGVKAPVDWISPKLGREEEDYLAHNRRGRGTVLQARMPCGTDKEARTFLEAAIAELQRAAREKGVSLIQDGGRGQSPADSLTLGYDLGRYRGSIEVYYQAVKRASGSEYSIRYTLEESP